VTKVDFGLPFFTVFMRNMGDLPRLIILDTSFEQAYFMGDLMLF
jgi:hypothetical protein